MRRTAIMMAVGVWLGLAGWSAAKAPETLPQPKKSEPAVTSENAPVEDHHPVAESGKGRAHRSCFRAVKDWLCYRSAKSNKQCHPVPCCRPPNYAFFLWRCGAAVEDCPDDQAIVVRYNYTRLLDCLKDAPGVGCVNCK